VVFGVFWLGGGGGWLGLGLGLLRAVEGAG